MQDNMEHSNIRKTGMPEGEDEEEGGENLFKKVKLENIHKRI